VQKAARGGFNINGANNGMHLEYDLHPGSHIDYNYTVWQEVEQIAKANPNVSDSKAAQLLQTLTDKLRERVANGTLPIE